VTYIIVEGVSASGKTTVVASLARRIKAIAGVEPLLLHEPQQGKGTVGHEILRRLEHGPRIEQWEAVGLFKADRIQQRDSKVMPALQAGRVVIQEGSWLSTSVYNAFWGERSSRVQWPDADFMLHHHKDLMPHPTMTILLKIGGREAAARLMTRALRSGTKLSIEDGMRDLETWGRRYEILVRGHTGWWGDLVRIDASMPQKKVVAEAWEAARRWVETPA
jgi:thymidylate kinase